MFMGIDEFRAESNLTDEELAKIIQKMQNNIVDKMKFLVYSNARPYRKFSNYEDVVQEGFVGLIRSVHKFKWSLFPNFFVYSNQWVRHYTKRAASRFDVMFNPNKSRVVYSEPDENKSIPAEDTPDGIFFRQERANGVNEILNHFPDRDKEIVRMIFGLGGYKPQTLRKIGSRFNLTHERVRQIKNNVLNKLRKNQTLRNINQNLR